MNVHTDALNNRQMLDMAAAGKVKILEKDDPLSNSDVEANLCVMLLMLQAANRQSKETLTLLVIETIVG
jgi:type III restriction enzyme